ncbi:hypothetical protein CDAR_372601 [Caerostris darwini]|uniref:Uncharacterized protein n=1 Tax=Caerostris darwini TaxID=1538125 RepID=A0AAV4T9P1_9ARAC|nr:hypothetical protein CDAR_372601 [Caerostris darwini]
MSSRGVGRCPGGQAKRRKGPNRIPLPNQEERSRRLRRRERKGRKEEEKKEEKKRSPKEGLIILPKNGHSLSNLTEDIEMNGVRLVREGEKCLYSRRGLSNRFAANPEYHPEGPAVVQGADEKEDRPQSNSLPNQEEKSRRLRRRERKGRKEEEKKRSPKEGLIILRKNGRSLSSFAQDIVMNGVRPVKEGRKMSLL